MVIRTLRRSKGGQMAPRAPRSATFCSLKSREHGLPSTVDIASSNVAGMNVWTNHAMPVLNQLQPAASH